MNGGTQNESLTTHLELAGFGWQQPGWTGTFYPDDMPDEWQLGFYANQYQNVVVPAEYWLREVAPDVEQWREDVPETFRFYLHVDAALLKSERWARVVDAVREMGDLFAAVIVDVAAKQVELENIKRMIKSVRELANHKPVFVAGMESKGIDGLDVELCWTGGETACGRLGMKRYSTTPDLKTLRHDIERFVQCASRASHDAGLLLFIEGAPDILENGVTITELLGF